MSVIKHIYLRVKHNEFRMYELNQKTGVLKMKTETKLVYVSFSKYSDNGLSYHVFNTDMREHLESDDDYTFLCEIVVPVLTKRDIERIAVAKFDKEIAGHAVAIEALKTKIQQLLCLEHIGGES